MPALAASASLVDSGVISIYHTLDPAATPDDEDSYGVLGSHGTSILVHRRNRIIPDTYYGWDQGHLDP